MATAASSFEVRVAEVLVASPDPMSAAAILDVLKERFMMTRLKKSDVNSTLYATAAYGSVPGSQPPLWFVRGTAADHAVAAASSAAADTSAPYSLLCDIPPLRAVPNGEFQGGTVVVAGEATDAIATAEAVELLSLQGAGRLRCLVGQAAGEAAVGAAEGPGVETVTIGYAAGRQADPRRAVADGHAAAMAAPDPPVALCLIGPPVTSDYRVHHILAAFEAHGIPVYLHAAAGGAALTSDCGAC
jgi:hypothetical protein